MFSGNDRWSDWLDYIEQQGACEDGLKWARDIDPHNTINCGEGCARVRTDPTFRPSWSVWVTAVVFDSLPRPLMNSFLNMVSNEPRFIRSVVKSQSLPSQVRTELNNIIDPPVRKKPIPGNRGQT